ncbi:MAG: tetratricopeptide repeat protein, partial [Gammaproteobacteria bacterium]
MRNYLCCLILLVLAPVSSLLASPLQEGLRAYEAGNYPAAQRHWSPLAEQGDADAQYNMGLLFLNGRGVPQDERAAGEWFKKAARQGSADAQYNLGVLYYKGRGLARSSRDALLWWTVAADKSHA